MKKLMVSVLAVVLVMSCVSAFAAGQIMCKEDAMKAAVEHAGLKMEQVNFTKVHQDWDDGRQVYEIEFYFENTEYDVEVDILTGRVTEFNVERHGRYDHHDWDDDHDDWDDDWDDWFDFD